MSLEKAALLLALVTLALPATAQDWKGMGRMSGKVMNAEGKSIANLVIKFELPGCRGQTAEKALDPLK